MSDHVLSDALASLDTQADRIANLNNLLTSLSWQEARHMKDLFRFSFLRRDFADLPPEILSQIVHHLDADHLVACLAVSRKWRAKFSSRPVLFGVCEYRFPDLINGRMSLPDDSSFPDKVLAAIRSVARFYRDPPLRKGIVRKLDFGPSEAFALDRNFHDFGESEQEAYDLIAGDLSRYKMDASDYFDGKMVWLAHCPDGDGPDIIVLDDFRSSKRKFCGIGALHSANLQVRCIGEVFIVAASGRHVYAWNHLEPGPLHHAILSSTVGLCETVDDTVAIFIVGSILLWKPGRKGPFIFYQQATQARSPQLQVPEDVAGAILDPKEGKERLFVVLGEKRDAPFQKLSRIPAIYEIGLGKPIIERHIDTRYCDPLGEYNCYESFAKKSNSFGLYHVAQSKPSNRGQSVLIEFDIESRKFITTEYQIPEPTNDHSDPFKLRTYNGALFLERVKLWAMIRNEADLVSWDLSGECASALKPRCLEARIKPSSSSKDTTIVNWNESEIDAREIAFKFGAWLDGDFICSTYIRVPPGESAVPFPPRNCYILSFGGAQAGND